MRVVAVLTLIAFAAAGVAFADDPFQGNWEGKFTSKGWKDRAVSAKMIADSDTSYRVLFDVDGIGGVFAGARPDKDARTAAFDGKIDLGEALGGECKVWGVIMDKKFNGALYVDGKAVDFEMDKVEKKSPTLGAKAPEGAVVLFDGTNTDSWQRLPLAWNIVGEGAMEVGGSSLVTKQEFGSGKWHVEFRTPLMANERGQGRGNSGVYLMGRYEVQVLDSFGEEPRDNEFGGIYKVAVPLSNECLPPTEWQTYDITITAPKFDGSGKKTENARITVVANGVTIHDNLVLPDVTPGGVSDKESPKGVLMLQDHGNSVRYRNIWFLPAQE